jgi:hypothetical protein
LAVVLSHTCPDFVKAIRPSQMAFPMMVVSLGARTRLETEMVVLETQEGMRTVTDMARKQA